MFRNYYLQLLGIVTVLSSLFHSPLMLHIRTFKSNGVGCTCIKIYM